MNTGKQKISVMSSTNPNKTLVIGNIDPFSLDFLTVVNGKPTDIVTVTCESAIKIRDFLNERFG